MGEHTWEKDIWIWKFLQNKFKQQPNQRGLQQICVLFSLFGDTSEIPGLTSQLQGLGMWGIELNSAALLLPPRPPFKKAYRLLGKKPISKSFSTSQIPAHMFSPTSFISGTFGEKTWVIKEWLVIKLTGLLVRQGKLPQKLQSPCYTNWCI